MGRRLKSTIPVRIRNDVPNENDVHMELQRRQVSQKRNFDRRARSTDLPLLHPVRVQHPITGRWNPATVHAKSDEPRSYILRNMNGKEFRRNRQHIRESCQLPHQSVEPPENAHATPTRLPTASTETELPNTVTPSVPPSTPARYTTRSGRVVRNPRRLDY